MGMTDIELRPDSLTVCRWKKDALIGIAHLQTKAQGQVLIRRRVDDILQVVNELGLYLSVTFLPVKS